MGEVIGVDPFAELSDSLGLTIVEKSFLKVLVAPISKTSEFWQQLKCAALGLEDNAREACESYSRKPIKNLWTDYFDKKTSIPAYQLDGQDRHFPSYHMHAEIDKLIAPRLGATLELLICQYQREKSENSKLHIYDLAYLTQSAIKIITLFNYSETLAAGGNQGKLPEDVSVMSAIGAGSRVALYDIANMLLATNTDQTELPYLIPSLEMCFRKIMNGNLSQMAPHQTRMSLAPDREYLFNNFEINGTGEITIKFGSPLHLAVFFSRNSRQELVEEFASWVAGQKNSPKGGRRGATSKARTSSSAALHLEEFEQIHPNYWAGLLAIVSPEGKRMDDEERLEKAKQLYIEIIEQKDALGDGGIELDFDGQLESYHVLIGTREPFYLIRAISDSDTSGCPFRKTMIEFFKILAHKLPGLDMSTAWK